MDTNEMEVVEYTNPEITENVEESANTEVNEDSTVESGLTEGDAIEGEEVVEKDIKYTYIKHDLKGYYITLNYMLPKVLYDNLGETWEDFVNNKWVLLSEEQAKFREENPNAKIHEVFNMAIDPAPVRTIENAKTEMKSMIDKYDNGSSVNAFTINGTIEHWFTVQERTNYKSSIDAAKLVGVETLSFYVGDTMLSVPTEMAEVMLAQIQLYADQCFIVTKQHKANVDALETIEEVDAYNYRVGYPEKLNFNLE